MKQFFVWALLVSAGASSLAPRLFASQANPSSDWYEEQFEYSVRAILKNIVGAEKIFEHQNPHEDSRGIPGAVLAAPSERRDTNTGEVHNYNWVWKRDAALTISALVDLADSAFKGKESALLLLFSHYLKFSNDDVALHHGYREGLGEAKITPFNEVNIHPWGGPQTDGPALQTLAALKILDWIQSTGLRDTSEAARARSFIDSIVSENVKYTLRKHSALNVDTWEEVKANSHFSTVLVQLASLDDVLTRMRAGQFQELRAHEDEIGRAIGSLNANLRQHLSADRQYIIAHLGVRHDQSLVSQKPGNLDTEVVLALQQVKKSFGVDRSWVRSTVEAQRKLFVRLFPVNANGRDAGGKTIPGYAVGRYEGDRHFGGQIWPLTTMAHARHYFEDAGQAIQDGFIEIGLRDRSYFIELGTGLSPSELQGRIEASDPRFAPIIDALMKRGKDILKRIEVHTGSDRKMTEVLDKDNGYKHGIEDLTWSYVEYVKAYRSFVGAKNRWARVTPPTQVRRMPWDGELCRGLFR